MPKIADIDEKELRRLIEDETRTQDECAEHFGVNRSTIQRRCYKLGLKTQRTGPRNGERHFRWKGGRTQSSNDGYWYRYAPDHPRAVKGRYVLEHRLVMEEAIGRFLTGKEVVHHRNADREDNRIENLELFESNGKHLRHELSGSEIHKKSVQAGMKKSAKYQKWLAACDRRRTQTKNRLTS